ncbi:hypothetical protein [Acinetobacter oleivorans]|uniref:hypothetical protein n=1 Tax=Acinetobacter oleivorans TaxID=1148157 RepID=UPI00125F6DA2|nr:hypothetical protein [Acinetobacter oleivorans]
MKVISINWLGSCDKCGSNQLLVKTEHGNKKLVYEEDKILCTNCGRTGVVNVTDDYADDCVAFAVWDETTESGASP